MPGEIYRMFGQTKEIIEAKLREESQKKADKIESLGGADYTSALHDDASLARDMQFIDATIANLTELLLGSEVINESETGDTVQLGTVFTVRFLDEDSEEEVTYRLGTALDATYNKTGIQWVSIESPMGQGVLGKTANSRFEIKLPNGTSTRIKLTKIGES